MIEKSFIVAFIVFFIHLMLQDGEVFGFIGNWLKKHLPKEIHKPAFDCPTCMTPWWGSLVIASANFTSIKTFQKTDVWHWLFILAIASGISTVLVELKPKKEIEVKELGPEKKSSENKKTSKL